MNNHRLIIAGVSVAALVLASCGDATSSHPNRAASLITSPIDESARVVLAGNTRPEATAENDRGRVDDGLVLDHMQLLLQRSAEQEGALTQLNEELQTPSSPNYHQWLTATEFGERFGAASGDIATLSGWLESHGFEINTVHPGGMIIDFTGTAGQVRDAFATEIHSLEVNGVPHIANLSDPTIPAALAPAVVGLVSLNDFRPHPMVKPRQDYTFTSGSSTYQAVVPADLATIYNFNPLFSAGVSGAGETVVVIEDTNLYTTADWTTFRSELGLSSYTSGKLVTANPAPASGKNNCTSPGVNSDDFEAILDAEWASAAAPSATVEVASCKDTSTTFGGLIAFENVIAEKTPPTVISISYGECEAEDGATQNAAYKTEYEEAATEGISVFVSAGDEGAASCDADEANATHGIGVSGFASTPYNVAVGGTDFGDSYAGTNSTYWSSTNSSTYESALSYVPEIPWNDSCASSLLATLEGSSATYGSTGFCNSTTGKKDFLTTASGSGGPSGCATGAAKTSGVVGGTCDGYAKPSWQSVLGNPSDGVRDIPDVSLFAANGVWGHYYVVCDSDTKNGGAKCTGAPSGWSGAGGTSFASPIMAGLQSLVNQKWGKQGLPTPKYYSIAASEYGTSGDASCNSSSGKAASSSCTFYDVTQGDMDVNCTGSNDCYKPSGTYGVLSTSDSAYDKAYGTQTGWDFATGLGTVNAANLVNSTAW